MTKKKNKPLGDILLELTEDLVNATQKRDEIEVDYELEKADLMFDARVDNLKNQAQRDAQITKIMHKSGAYRDLAQARTDSRVAYYRWAAIKSLVDKGGYEKGN
jgi:hypothetical protein